MKLIRTSLIVMLAITMLGLFAVSELHASPDQRYWPLPDSAFAVPGSAESSNQSSPVRADGQRFSPVAYAQNQNGKLRSRSEVIAEVKRRYNAEVVRISLAKSGDFYNVRILMPNGKVRNIRVSARR